MLDERALSTLCGMTDLYIVGLGGGEQDRGRRTAERKAERRRLADRYACRGWPGPSIADRGVTIMGMRDFESPLTDRSQLLQTHQQHNDLHRSCRHELRNRRQSTWPPRTARPRPSEFLIG
jgi:hypothetical protein